MENITQLQKEIHTTLEEFQSLSIVQSHLDEINQNLGTANQKLIKLDKEVEKELAEWEKMEKLGIKSTFYKILGSKEEQLEKERQEYLEIALKYNEHKKTVELLEYEKEILLKKAKLLPAVRQKLEDLKKKRELEISSSPNSKAYKELVLILQESDSNILITKEVQEAIEAGKLALNSLQQIRNYLKKAADWGRWDMQGRGNYSAHMKHSSIEKARRVIHKAQHELNMFSRELRDIDSSPIHFNLQLDNFSKFTDFFFDNLISDWIIQQKIKNSINNVEATLDKLSRITASLEHELNQLHLERKKLSDQRNSILLS